MQALWYTVCTRMWYVVSQPVCGYTGIAVKVTIGHIKVHINSRYKKVVIFKSYIMKVHIKSKYEK